MKFNFDEPVNRKNSHCIKYDGMKPFLGINDDAIPMWVADMDFKTAPCIIDALQNKLNHGVFGYGLKPDAFYESIIGWMKKRHNWEIDKKWISFSPGVVAGFTIAIEQFSVPGDKILIQSPVYFPFFQSITDTGRIPIYNKLVLDHNRLCIDFNDFEDNIKQGVKLLLLCNPHNPGGSVWRRDELLKMAQICEHYNVQVISDEIHADIVFSPNVHIPFASLNEWASINSVTVLSHSKTFNLAGLTTSYVIIPNYEMLQKYNKALHVPHLHMGNVFGTEALISAYTDGEPWLEELKLYLGENIRFASEFISTRIPKLSVIAPESTFLIWVDCRKLNLTNIELKHLFLSKAKVAINEGSMFGPGGEGFIRLNIGCTKENLKKALIQIEKTINTI